MMAYEVEIDILTYPFSVSRLSEMRMRAPHDGFANSRVWNTSPTLDLSENAQTSLPTRTVQVFLTSRLFIGWTL